MAESFNIYCDESCHLERDKQPIMLLGAVWCPEENTKKYSETIRQIKEAHRARGEMKWTKVSKSRIEFFHHIVDFFFDTQGLNFRGLMVDDKSKLNHEYYNHGSHDSFYYKMYFYLIRNIITPEKQFSIYIDIKDTRSQLKIVKLHEVLCNNFCDFNRDVICKAQHVRSNESELLQLADLIIGAISYKNRGLTASKEKLDIVGHIQQRAHSNLRQSTPPWEDKFNLFVFSPKEVTNV